MMASGQESALSNGIYRGVLRELQDDRPPNLTEEQAAGSDYEIYIKEQQRHIEQLQQQLLSSESLLTNPATIQTTPQRVEMVTDQNSNDTVGIAAAAGSDGHTLAIKKDGTVWAWGDNGDGQLGNYSAQPHDYSTAPGPVYGWYYNGYRNWAGVRMVDASDYASFAVKYDGTVWAWGYNYFDWLGVYPDDHQSHEAIVTYAMRVRNLYNVVAVSAAGHYCLAVDAYGDVYSWGEGCLGTGEKLWKTLPGYISGLSSITAVSAGENHALALDDDGNVWAWGYNYYGQLGDGTKTSHETPVKLAGLPRIKAIAAGQFNSLALAEDGTVYAWGSNSWGALGNGSEDDSASPVAISGLSNISAIDAGDYFSVALGSDGRVWTWGENSCGQLGNGTTNNSGVPLLVSGLSDISSIAAGGSHAMAIRPDGTLWMWGLNYYGQLGDGGARNRPQPGTIGSLSKVNKIESAPNSFNAYQSSGSILYWGDGQSTPRSRDVPTGTVRVIGQGTRYTIALKQDGTVWARGLNVDGLLGQQTTSYKSDIFLQVPIQGVTDLTSRYIEGYEQIVALKGDGTLWSWGGQYARHDGVYGYPPAQMTGWEGIMEICGSVFLKVDGTVWKIAVDSGAPEQVEAPPDIKAYYSDICLKKDGTVWTQGDNRYGELGIGEESNYSSEWVQVPDLSNIESIARGLYHNMALGSDGKVWTWGYNGDGAIGSGVASRWSHLYYPQQVPGLPEITAIAATQYSSAALSSNGTLYTWGNNGYGELGDNIELYKPSPFMNQIYTLPPAASFIVNPATPDTITIASFDAAASTAPNSSIVSYAWDFGDGTADSGVNPCHLFETAGDFTVTLTVTNEKGKTTTISRVVTVTYVPPVDPISIRLSRKTMTLQAGMGQATLTATLTPAKADRHITWKSDDETIARVENGKVTPIKEGTAHITATTVNNLSDTCTVTVTPPPVNLPLIKNVEMYIENERLPDSGLVFLSGVDLNVSCKPDVDWRGKAPGTLEFITPQGKFNESQSKSFNMGSDFGPGQELQVYAVDVDGKRSPVYYGKFAVAADPLGGITRWRYGKAGCAGNANVIYTSESNFAMGLVEQNVSGDKFTSDIPFFGAQEIEVKLYPTFTAEFDLKENKGRLILVKLDESAESERKSALKMAGMLIATAPGKNEVKLTIEAGLEFHLDTQREHWSYGGTATTGIEGYVQSPTVTWYIAVPAFPSPVPVNGRMGVGVKFDVTENLQDIIPVATSLSSLAPYLSGEAKLYPYGKVIGGVGIADKIEGQLIGQLGLEGTWSSDSQPLYYVLPSSMSIKGSISAALILFRFRLESPVYEYSQQVYGAQEFDPALANQGFELISRDYFEYGSTNFMAVAPRREMGLLSSDTLMVEDIIQTNTYPYSQPCLISGPDCQYLFWIEDDVQRDLGISQSPNSTELVFSIEKDGRRSMPLPVADDGTADFGVQALVMPDGRVMAVWENVVQKLPAGVSMDQMLASMDIAYAIYDPVQGTWTSGNIINDDSLDCSPRLAAAPDGTAMLCWTKNAANKILGDAQSPDTSMCSVWDGVSWSQPQAITTSDTLAILHSSLAYDGQQAWLVWESDADNSLETMADREIVGVHWIKGQGWEAARNITSNSLNDQSPKVLFAGGQPRLFWLQDNNLLMSSNIEAPDPQVIVDNTRTSGDCSYMLMDTATRLDLIWSGPSAEGSDIYLTHWDKESNLWGIPQQITRDEDLERSIAGCYTDKDQFALLYDKQRINHNQADELSLGQTNLCRLSFQESTDLELQSFYLDNQYLRSGESVSLDAVVRNNGQTVVDGYKVSFFKGDPANNENLIANLTGTAALLPGTTENISCNLILPTSDSLTIYARVDPAPGVVESNTANNSIGKAITIELPSMKNDPALAYLTPSNPFPLPGTPITIFTQVCNRGDNAIPSAIPVKLYCDGELIDTRSTTGPLDPSQSCDLVFSFNTEGLGRKNLRAVLELPDSVSDDQVNNNALSTPIDICNEVDYNPPAYLNQTMVNSNKVVSLLFNKVLYNNLASYSALKQAIQFSTDGQEFKALGENDLVTLNGCALVINFSEHITSDTNKIRVAGSALKSVSGNVLETPVETDCIAAEDYCFIATAAFGSKFSWPVVLLRHFRDQYLLTNQWGASFVRLYYSYSPPVARIIAHNQGLRILVRFLLAPIIAVVYLLYHLAPTAICLFIMLIGYVIIRKRYSYPNVIQYVIRRFLY